MSMNGKARRLCILTMINGTDVMGDLIGDPYTQKWATIEHPCLLQLRPPNNVVLNDLLKNSPALSGTSIMINMNNVQWIVEPSSQLLSHYQATRAGLIIDGSTAPHMNA